MIAEAYRMPGASGVIWQGRHIGDWTRTTPPEPGFPWFTLGMQSNDLAMVIGELLQGRLHSPTEIQTWQFGVAITTLGQLTGVGPTHHLVGSVIGPTHDLIGHLQGGDGRGAFTFYPVGPTEIPTYPSLWAADAPKQTRITVQPTHSGRPVSTDPRNDPNLSNMLAQRSDLFISRNLCMTSQALAIARTDRQVMGGSSWTALRTGNDAVKAALAIWCNSTLGLMMRVSLSQTTQLGAPACKSTP